MNYILTSEIPLYSPQNTIPSNAATQQGYINAACAMADAVCRRSRWGLGVRFHTNYTVETDVNFSGKLPNYPWVAWTSPTALLIQVGISNVNSNATITDWDVEPATGVFRTTRYRLIGSFATSQDKIASPFRETMSPYHQGSYQQIDGNPYPYWLQPSWAAGYFLISAVAASASAGSNVVTVTPQTAQGQSSILGVNVQDEFYFDQDIAGDPTIDTRIVTAVNGNQITFDPPLGYNLTVPASFRKVDLNIRRSIGQIISKMLTYPTDTRDFRESLGNNAITDHYISLSKTYVPDHVASILSSYMMVG